MIIPRQVIILSLFPQKQNKTNNNQASKKSNTHSLSAPLHLSLTFGAMVSMSTTPQKQLLSQSAPLNLTPEILLSWLWPSLVLLLPLQSHHFSCLSKCALACLYLECWFFSGPYSWPLGRQMSFFMAELSPPSFEHSLFPRMHFENVSGLLPQVPWKPSHDHIT